MNRFKHARLWVTLPYIIVGILGILGLKLQTNSNHKFQEQAKAIQHQTEVILNAECEAIKKAREDNNEFFLAILHTFPSSDVTQTIQKMLEEREPVKC